MTSEPALRVLATCRAKADRIAEAKEVMTALVEPSRAEEGCHRYVLWQDNAEPARFAFVEEWADEAALALHAQSEHVQIAREQFPSVLDGAIEIRKFSLVG